MVQAEVGLTDEEISKLESEDQSSQEIGLSDDEINKLEDSAKDKEVDVKDVLGRILSTTGPNRLGADIISGRVGEEDASVEVNADTVLGIMEGATGGIPRGIVERAVGRELDIRGNIAGRIAGATVGLSRTAGIAGAKVAAKLGAKSGGIIQSVVAGASSAVAMAPEGTRNPFDPLQKAGAATVGALGGLFIGGILKTVSVFNKGKLIKEAGEEASNITKQLDTIAKDMELAKTNTGRYARQGALAVQKRFRKFSNQASDGYETLLKKVEGKMPDKIKKNDVVKLLEESIDESVTDGLDSGPAFKELVRLKNNYTDLQKPTLENIFKGVKTGERVDSRELRKAFTKGAANEEISLKELIKVKRLVRQRMTSGFKKGTQRADADDVPANIFMKKLGEFTEQFSPELSSSNRIWSRVVDTQKKAVKIFGNKVNPLETKSGTDFITKAAKGELEGGEALFLKRLQQGVKPFTPGIGNVVSKAEREIGREAALKIQQTDLQAKIKELDKLLGSKNAGKLEKTFKIVSNVAERVLLYKLLRKLPFLG